MYAIIRTCGKQYRVAQNDVILIDRLAASEGDEITIGEVLLVSAEKGVKIGTPFVDGATVVGEVVGHSKGKKIRGFTFKPKKDLRRHFGHRQLMTSVLIKDIKIGK